MWLIKRRNIHVNGDVYLTKYSIAGLRGWYLHVFHRGDSDPDPHDHPWAFDTFPLTAYDEDVWHNGVTVPRVVTAGRWHHRDAIYCHRVRGPHWEPYGAHQVTNRWKAIAPRSRIPWYTRICWMLFGQTKIVTIIKHGEETRKWGFRCSNGVWVPWRQYIDKAKTWMP